MSKYELGQAVYLGRARSILKGEITKITQSKTGFSYEINCSMYSGSEISPTFEIAKQEMLDWAKKQYESYVKTINGWVGCKHSDKDLTSSPDKVFTHETED